MKQKKFGTIFLTICITVAVICFAVVVLGVMYLKNRQTAETEASQQLEASTTDLVTEAETEAQTEAETEAPTEAETEAETEALTEAPTEAETEAVEMPSVTATVETYSNAPYEGSVSYLWIDGDFDYVTVFTYSESGDTYNDSYPTYTTSDNPIDLCINKAADSSAVFVEVVPYREGGIIGEAYVCEVPALSGSVAVDSLLGQINCHGGVVAGYTTDYVCNGGSCSTVRKSLGDTWHVTAKNMCVSYGITWYELWDTDDGDYYGGVASDYIDFY